MKYICLSLGLLSLVTGLASARYWLRSSQVKVDPGWAVEPGDAPVSQAGWTGALLDAGLKAARINKVAAILAALSVASGGIANFISLLR
ncbi:TPA: hypothetical protein ACGCD9_004470 [Stenotrophomonas maltophilia]|uniref:hypothetical protein n=1 Tax=Stenotrophomonas geniculata TaxID=86188 RepID=UPI002E766044|nr:hypothetical protein [Stenotrophomonas geniculata]